MKRLNVPRCQRGMEQIEVNGLPNTEPRAEVIEAAIAEIQRDPERALADEFVGVKNYAGFGDQHVRCRYGYGPRHGAVVFRVGRVSARREGPLDSDAVYLLEAVRDFGSIDDPRPSKQNGRYTEQLNLCGAIRLLEQVEQQQRALAAALTEARVDSHVEEEVPA